MIVELYTKDNCGYCIAAKTLLNNSNIQFTENKLGVHFTQDTLKTKYPYASTFPVVVVDGFYIGGYNQLNEQLLKNSSYTSNLLNEFRL